MGGGGPDLMDTHCAPKRAEGRKKGVEGGLKWRGGVWLYGPPQQPPKGQSVK